MAESREIAELVALCAKSGAEGLVSLRWIEDALLLRVRDACDADAEVVLPAETARRLYAALGEALLSLEGQAP
ncbi:MAG: hypothetical protein ACYTGX_15910 [Planctomycetota bacterium]|jgi:hypothetical protein